MERVMLTQGLLVGLAKPEQHDIPMMVEWLNHESFYKNLYGSPMSSEAERERLVIHWLMSNASDSSADYVFLAKDLKTRRPLGMVFYNHLSWKHRHAELNIVISDPDFLRGFFGFDLYFVALMTAFQDLNLHKLFGYTYAFNTKALSLNNFGGRACGMLSNHRYQHGSYVDVMCHEVLARDFATCLKKEKYGRFKKYENKGFLDCFDIF